jgi:hypothetical protein
LKFENAKLGTIEQRRIAAAMERLGWIRERGGRRIKGQRFWVSAAAAIAEKIDN